MKKFLVGVICILALFVTACSKQETLKEESDAIKFKSEYESLNGKKNESNGKEYRKITIPNDNPFIYKSAEEIAQMIENKETFVVYFGFNSCPWCRSIIETLIKVANDLNLEKIYYVDVKEIRDVLKVDENGNIITETKGTKGYYQLLEQLETVLKDYNLVDLDGKSIATGEKRITAPNVVSIVDGVAKELKTGISKSQIDGYMELTEEMKLDTYEQLKCVLSCVANEKEACPFESSC